jgi:hypothetical protein
VTDEDVIRQTARINYEIVITHGLEGGVGFLWKDTFIHDPFVDPQYGAFPVDPVVQYGDSYRQSIFVTNPTKVLETAQQQLRDKASEDLRRYCADNELDTLAIIETVCGVQVREDDQLRSLTDEHVAQLWAHVDGVRKWA